MLEVELSTRCFPLTPCVIAWATEECCLCPEFFSDVFLWCRSNICAVQEREPPASGTLPALPDGWYKVVVSTWICTSIDCLCWVMLASAKPRSQILDTNLVSFCPFCLSWTWKHSLGCDFIRDTLLNNFSPWDQRLLFHFSPIPAAQLILKTSRRFKGLLLDLIRNIDFPFLHILFVYIVTLH